MVSLNPAGRSATNDRRSAARRSQIRATNILEQIRALTDELEDLLVVGDADSATLSTPAVGDSIAIDGGKYQGETGRISGAKGSQFWWVILDGNEQKTVYVMKHNVKIVRRE